MLVVGATLFHWTKRHLSECTTDLGPEINGIGARQSAFRPSASLIPPREQLIDPIDLVVGLAAVVGSHEQVTHVGQDLSRLPFIPFSLLNSTAMFSNGAIIRWIW